MFDINLLNKPGLQNGSEDKAEKKNKSTIEQKPSRIKNDDENNKDNNKIALIFFTVLVLVFSGLIYNKNNFKLNFKNIINQNEITINSNFINLLIENHEFMDIKYIQFNNEEVNVKFSTNNVNNFYSLLDNFSKLVGNNIKGYHLSGNYLLDINSSWILNKDKNINLNLLDKELSDINPLINKEIYKNKLIIVSDIKNILSILQLISKINLLDKYLISIQNIDTLPNNIDLYQLIIQ